MLQQPIKTNGDSVALKLVVCHQNVEYLVRGNYVSTSARKKPISLFISKIDTEAI